MPAHHASATWQIYPASSGRLQPRLSERRCPRRGPAHRKNGVARPRRHDWWNVPDDVLESAPIVVVRSHEVGQRAVDDPSGDVGMGAPNRARSGPALSFRRLAERSTFFMPAAILLLLLVFYPIATTIILSFFSGSSFVGLGNYGAILQDPATLNPNGLSGGPPYGTLVNNLLWIVIHLPLSLFTGLVLAVLLPRVTGASLIQSYIYNVLYTRL